ncbi:MAG: hypothetical protein Q7S07_05555 [Candidatus Omnitrophota bacterium]|nr:hypothetical protein [Candidatus Omnitrophota bacterium]
MAETISPEEKLFKIIQQEKRASPEGGGLAQKKGAFEWIEKSGRLILLWKEKWISLTKDLFKKAGIVLPGKLREPELKNVNIALSAALFFLALFVIYYAVTKYPNTAKIVSATAVLQSSLPGAAKDIESLHQASYYTEDAKRRDIFTAARNPVAAAPEAAAKVQDKSSAGDLKLQGISWNDTPKVMIQSQKDNKFYILKEGQQIGMTGVKVKTILRNKVILNSGDADFEL